MIAKSVRAWSAWRSEPLGRLIPGAAHNRTFDRNCSAIVSLELRKSQI